jgi:hypothetical protein
MDALDKNVLDENVAARVARTARLCHYEEAILW